MEDLQQAKKYMILGLVKGEWTRNQALKVTSSYTLDSLETDSQMKIHVQEFY